MTDRSVIVFRPVAFPHKFLGAPQLPSMRAAGIYILVMMGCFLIQSSALCRACWRCSPEAVVQPHAEDGRADRNAASRPCRGWAGWRLCRRQLAALCRWARRKHGSDVAGIGRLERHVTDLLAYLERNQEALVPYAARRRRGEPISTAFVESAVGEIIA